MGAKTLLTTIAVVSMLLTACTSADAGISASGEASPTASETLTPPSPTPTPSPSLTPLTDDEVLAAIPEWTLGESIESAAGFSRFYVELYPTMFTEPYDTRVFGSLATTNCNFCAETLERVASTEQESAYSTGGSFTWPNAEDYVNVARGGLSEDGYWYIEQDMVMTTIETYSEDGTPLGSSPGGSGLATTKLSWSDGLWAVEDVYFLFDDE
ncbi:hypothetical protein [Demequina sediminicola]|uniref:hypothetical protein n=1 Tax=Demequina sediminicola TaxID=1095026 RepID=UPI0007842531|nr:hypothetical protein [Demequina sediminicola]